MKFTIVALFALASVSAVRLTGDDVDHSTEFYEASDNGVHMGKVTYERVAPSYFSDEGDDLFMKSMIMQYAQEGKNKDGTPAHHFFMSEALTKSAASEVLENNAGIKAGEKDAYMTTYFPRTWAHFDVNHTGRVAVETMPQFMRFLASNQELKL